MSEKDSNQRAFSILLIEDNPADVELVREALEEHGIAGVLLVISDGGSAIDYIEELTLQSACPKLVILDLNLPRRTGRDVLQSIRQNEACGNTTVVILSSSDAQQDRTESMTLGASRYIRKPLRLEEFLRLGAVFKTILESSAGHSA